MIAIILFTVYVGLCIVLFKDLGSISQSYYEWEKKKKHLGGLFTLWAFTTMFLVCPQALDISSDSWRFLIFFAAVALGFVGAAPLYDGEVKNRDNKDVSQKKVHYSGAVICMATSTLWIIIDTRFWFIPLIFYSLAICLSFKYKERKLLLIEIAAFYSLLITLLIIKH